ncbi:MAG: Vms1/Ankzf1 family peptidyl-tRNA hydrolase [Gaiellaceae bacterium]
MAATVNWNGLRDLASFRAEKGCAISCFVNLDPSISPTSKDVDARVSALLQEGEKTESERRSELTHEQREALHADFARIQAYFDNEFSREGAQGLAIFVAGLDNFWRAISLSEPVPDEINVGRQFLLAPLVPLVGRSEGALVCVVGRERGEIYQLRGGRLHELVEQFDEQLSRHDQGGWSQARYQRHIEKHVLEHLKEVAELLDRHVRRLHRPPVVVVASEETRTEFDDLLSHDVKSVVIGWTTAESHAAPPELLEIARPVLEEWRSRQEDEAIQRWREEAGRHARAAAGWPETLEAASDGRVELLLFEEGVDRPAWQCPACGRLSSEAGACPLDGTRMEERAQGLDLAVHQTLAHGGSVLALRHHRDLEPVEGVGALLRY